MGNKLLELFRCQEFQPLDHYFARQMLKLASRNETIPNDIAEAVYLASGMVCSEAANGNVCMNIADFAGVKLQATLETGKEMTATFPEQSQWEQRLESSVVVGAPATDKPLILEKSTNNTFLYLNRYWQYEYRLAKNLHRMMQPVDVDEALLQEGLSRLFPPAAQDNEFLQAVAAEAAIRNSFCVISGGPGTGKTSVVIKIIALLIEQAGEEKFHLKLAAPTGKAAFRLQNAVSSLKQRLRDDGFISPLVCEKITEEATTLHRLLGAKRNSVSFHHNRKNRLDLDCLVIDEASMVDLAMMCKVVDALPENARLILLGDMDQLSSVEAGSVFADICAVDKESASYGTNVVTLTHSYRFDEQSGIGKLSGLIKNGMNNEAWESLQSAVDQRIIWRDIPSRADFRRALTDYVLPHYEKYLAISDIEEAFAWLQSFSVLCALRNGFYGARAINALIEELLRENKILFGDDTWYQGKPIMVIRNDYQQQLFNGDVGIVFEDPKDKQQSVLFQTAESGRYRKISPGRLPDHDTAYAITVHKSQGSEYDRILHILPDTESYILTRELIYTAITRARHEVEIWSSKDVFLSTIHRKSRRNSGLTEKMKGFASQA